MAREISGVAGEDRIRLGLKLAAIAIMLLAPKTHVFLSNILETEVAFERPAVSSSGLVSTHEFQPSIVRGLARYSSIRDPIELALTQINGIERRGDY